MKAFLSIKYHADHSNRAHIQQLSRALETCGYTTVVIARDVEQWGQVALSPAELMRQTFVALEGCDLVVVDLTEKGVGIGIEAGYAHAKGIPIVAMARQGRDISTTLQGIARQTLWYDSYQEIEV